MTELLRIWTGLAALGAGVVHLALAVDAPVPVATTSAVLGMAAVAWGAATFARDRPPVPRAALAVSLAPVVAGAALPLAPTSAIASAIPMERGLTLAIVIGLDAAVALLLAVGLRREARRADASRSDAAEPRPARLLLGVGAGALLVAALATPAIAASPAGDGARPHGSHPLVELPLAPHHP